ncbi:unnamed protein product [Orchesella dallaii]|uniref:Uncharacterized protein n=1 Tax=Orchesella dallaii TaxID=48710 RepID=A0ABP1RXR7_9HEXA
MRDAGSQLWLTSAITNDDVAKALTLCFSLKKRLSSRKIGVIVSKEVSSSFRKALRHGFDFVFNLEEDEKPTNLRMEEFVKLYGLTLKSFQKVVYLKPSMIVIKNSDEIFDIHKKSGFTWGEGGALSVLLMKPSLETFRILMKDLETRNGNGNTYSQFITLKIRKNVRIFIFIYVSVIFNKS